MAGFPGRPADWMLVGGVPEAMNSLIESKQVGPIVVAPDSDGGFRHDSECLNQVGGPQIATYLTSTVVQYVDTHFHTLRNRESRAIGGMSSGGYCSVNLALRNQNTFSNIVAFEPYGTPGESVVGPLMDAGADSAHEVARVHPLAEEMAVRGQTVSFRAEPGQTRPPGTV